MKITPRKYARALAMMLDSVETTIIKNFLEVLQSRNQMKLLPKILPAFDEEWRKIRGIVKVEVQYPEKFEESLHELEKAIKERFGDKVIMTAKPSSELIGGFRMKLDDNVIDASVQGMLAALEHKLTTNNQQPLTHATDERSHS